MDEQMHQTRTPPGESGLAGEFFDHILRSSESYSEKWNYVRDNPVRAGLVANADDWPWQGQIEELRM
jgi:hypothetical protein